VVKALVLSQKTFSGGKINYFVAKKPPKSAVSATFVTPRATPKIPPRLRNIAPYAPI
jgi:hypothetical protein